MKVCPVCKAACFDDMEVCYGCLHRFSPEREEDLWAELEQEELLRREELLRQEQLLTQEAPSSDRVQIPFLFNDQKLRGFKITFEPVY